MARVPTTLLIVLSMSMHDTTEGYLGVLMRAVWRDRCTLSNAGTSASHDQFWFADSGSNEGGWSILAAAHGCRVLSVDPQPLCIRMLEAAARKNRLDSAIETHNAVLAPRDVVVKPRGGGEGGGSRSSERPRPQTVTQVPFDQCHGTATFRVDWRTNLTVLDDTTKLGRQIGGAAHASDVRRHCKTPGGCTASVAHTSVDEITHGDNRTIGLWHVDVEGAEVGVLLSAASLFRERRIERIALEFTPFRWPNHGFSLLGGLTALQPLLGDGWTCHTVCPDQPSHHGVHFQWTSVRAAQLSTKHHMWLGNGKTVCENLWCVASGVDDDLPTLHRRVND
jgi:FkbM family methyltransferase